MSVKDGSQVNETRGTLGPFGASLSIKAIWIHNVNSSLNFLFATLWKITSGTEMHDCMPVICSVNTVERAAHRLVSIISGRRGSGLSRTYISAARSGHASVLRTCKVCKKSVCAVTQINWSESRDEAGCNPLYGS